MNKRYSTTERVGINAVEQLILNLGWIFREQLVADMGIDAHVERVDDGMPTGKLVALQIKTGMSHFKETPKSLVYYGSLTHLDYWTGHSLPVLLVAHLPESNETFWTVVNETTAGRTRKAWRVEIPKTSKLDGSSKDSLAATFEGTPAQQRFRKLSVDEPLMRHIAGGGKVSLELEDWVNKSLGRSPVEVFLVDENGEETLSREWGVMYTGYDIKRLAEALFPWADVGMDWDYYEEHGPDDDPRASLARAIDEDNGIVVDDDDVIIPYAEHGGEVESYRLELTLNELGAAFLAVSDFVTPQPPGGSAATADEVSDESHDV